MLNGCKKDEIEFSYVPIIEVLSVSPQNANEYSDNVIITLSYEDGDGDLGENDASVKNCFVRDSRTGVEASFRIQQLAPDNSAIPIKGTINIDLGGLGITNSSNSQSAYFTVYVYDRAGNKSNESETQSITIRKP